MSQIAVKQCLPMHSFCHFPTGDLESVASLGAGENVTIPEDENNVATEAAIDFMNTMGPGGMVSNINLPFIYSIYMSNRTYITIILCRQNMTL